MVVVQATLCAGLDHMPGVKAVEATENLLACSTKEGNAVKHDPVNTPRHYRSGDTYETIKVIEAWELNFHLGNTVKYISRAGSKGKYVEDLEKARWYLDREIANNKKSTTKYGHASWTQVEALAREKRRKR
jgi:Protein of unknwon function (DUF3310)